MSIAENMEIPVTSLQNEKIGPKEQVIRDLIARFHWIYILYDNDYDKETNWGRQAATALANRYGLYQIEIPEEFESKDFSDLVRNTSPALAAQTVFEIINNTLPF